MKLVVVISSFSGMASREFMEEPMVIGSMLARELSSTKSCGSVISNTLGSLKYLVSLGSEDLVRDSLWNVGGRGGCSQGGPRGSLSAQAWTQSWQVQRISPAVGASSQPTHECLLAWGGNTSSHSGNNSRPQCILNPLLRILG